MIRLFGGGGGGGGLPPGVSGDGANGLTATGDITSGDLHGSGAALQGSQEQVIAAGADGSASFLTPNGVVVQQAAGDSRGLYVHMSATTAGPQIVIQDHSFNVMYNVDSDGTVTQAGPIAVNGQTSPGYPVLATGAGHTVDDIITLLQDIGFCKQS